MGNEPFFLETEIGEIRIYGVREASQPEDNTIHKVMSKYPDEDLADTIARLLLENERLDKSKGRK